MILLIAFVLILILFTILQSLLNASLSEIVVHLVCKCIFFFKSRKTGRPQPPERKKYRFSALDTLYYTSLSLLYIYILGTAWQSLYSKTVIEYKALLVIVSLFIFVILGYLRKGLQKLSALNLESVVIGIFLGGIGLVVFLSQKPAKSDVAALFFNVAMAIVIIEQLFPMEEWSANYARSIEKNLETIARPKGKTNMPGYSVGIIAICAQCIGTIFSLSELKIGLAVYSLLAWLSICAGITYAITGIRVLQKRMDLRKKGIIMRAQSKHKKPKNIH